MIKKLHEKLQKELENSNDYDIYYIENGIYGTKATLKELMLDTLEDMVWNHENKEIIYHENFTLEELAEEEIKFITKDNRWVKLEE